MRASSRRRRILLKQNAAEINAYAASATAPNTHLLDLGKQYEAWVLSRRRSPEAGEQRKTLRSLQAPAAGATSRY